MTDPAGDPYADLLKGFRVRQADYLQRITATQEDFERDEVANGFALRRGYVRGQGPRPQCSLADQEAAAVAADDQHHLTVWTDNPCLRSVVGEPWDFEDLRTAIARLTVFPKPEELAASLVVPEPPPEGKTGIAFADLTALARQMTLMGRGDLRRKVRGLLGPFPVITQLGIPWVEIPLDPALVEQVVEALDTGSAGEATGQGAPADLVARLASLAVTGQGAPIGATDAGKALDGIYHLLPTELAAAVVNGVMRAATEVVALELQGPDALHPNLWAIVFTLGQFGSYGTDGSSVRQSLVSLARWLGAPPYALPEVKPTDTGKASLIEELFQWMWVPEGFTWPAFDREGLYWWRSVIRPHCIEQCFKLNETADFHSTDLIRLLYLFPAGDERIPRCVRTDAELALRWFKYWWDEPAAKAPNVDPAQVVDKDEMTMWSENHQILFAQSQLLAGSLFRGREFPRSGASGGRTRTGQVHVAEALPRVERWLDRRLRFGFSEWNAPGYYNEDLPPVLNLVDFIDAAAAGATGDAERQAFARIKVKAAMVADLIMFDIARFTCGGSFGVTAGRAYWEHKAYGWEQSIGNTIEFWWGNAAFFDHTLEATKADRARPRQPVALGPVCGPVRRIGRVGKALHRGHRLCDRRCAEGDSRRGRRRARRSAALPRQPRRSRACRQEHRRGLRRSVQGRLGRGQDGRPRHRPGLRPGRRRARHSRHQGPGDPGVAPGRIQPGQRPVASQPLHVEQRRRHALQRPEPPGGRDGLPEACLGGLPRARSVRVDHCEVHASGPRQLYRRRGAVPSRSRPAARSRGCRRRAGSAGAEAAGHGDPYGHDGPNYWTGTLALPMVVQHENAAIIAYNIPALQRRASGASTHAWFPKPMFTSTAKRDASGGSWFFGAKDSLDPVSLERIGAGYVALFTARQADWTNEPGNSWNDKEIKTSGGSNVWVCMVGSENQHGSFDAFQDAVLRAYLNVSGVGSLNPLECSFDIPGAAAPAGRTPRLELFYDSRTGRFAGEDLALDEFPRFENDYVQQVVTKPRPGTGVRPQVEGFSTTSSVPFGSSGYTIVHPATGLTLDHDLDTPARSHTSQQDQAIQMKAKDASSVLNNLPSPGQLDPGTWQQVLEYGEYVKFVQSAIDWDNVMVFLYPYFWDMVAHEHEKIFLDHPDPVHREFLRAGQPA